MAYDAFPRIAISSVSNLEHNFETAAEKRGHNIYTSAVINPHISNIPRFHPSFSQPNVCCDKTAKKRTDSAHVNE
jgi:hypothetical protein